MYKCEAAGEIPTERVTRTHEMVTLNNRKLQTLLLRRQDNWISRGAFFAK